MFQVFLGTKIGGADDKVNVNLLMHMGTVTWAEKKGGKVDVPPGRNKHGRLENHYV